MSDSKGRNWLAIFVLLPTLLAESRAAAQTRSISIGTLKYVGTATNDMGKPVSSYEILLDTSGVTETPITFSNLILFVKGGSLSTQQGGFPTITTGPGCGQGGVAPCRLLFEGGPGLVLPACGEKNQSQTCISIAAQLISLTGENFSFALANHSQFCAHGVSNTFLLAEQGKAALDPRCDAQGFCKGAPVPIVLHAAPASTCGQ
jgi:hypothetical protein